MKKMEVCLGMRHIKRWHAWCVESFMAVCGLLFSFLASWLFQLSACYLCFLARGVWAVYVGFVLSLWALDSYKIKNVYLVIGYRVTRLILIGIACVHLSVIYGLNSDMCISTDLMRLRGGLWVYLAELDLRSCGQEPMMWGWLSMPLVMLGVYLVWEFLDACRRKMVA